MVVAILVRFWYNGGMKVDGYIARLMDQVIRDNLDFYGAVLIEGCKWCGKSTTARHIARSMIEMQDPATAENNKEIARTDPGILLAGEKPRLIDEWQDTPAIWDAVRYDVDRSGLPGQYILTGSATPKVNKPSHSGAGRIVRLKMRPMTLFESGESNGSVSLAELFDESSKIHGSSQLGFAEIARLCVRGGWPLSVRRSPKDAGRVAWDYLETVLSDEKEWRPENDVSFVPSKMRAVIRSFARNIATPVAMQTILTDVESAGESLSDKTLNEYIAVLERVHILENIESWSPQLRSKTTIRSRLKRSFVDPSLAVAALHASEEDLRLDRRTFGLVFEALALRDLQVYAESLGGRVYYYRDKVGRECDAVIHLVNGKWGAVEIKLGSDEIAITEGAESLKKFTANIDTEVMHEPSFLMILTAATNYAYRREDGVLVVPVGCLRN